MVSVCDLPEPIPVEIDFATHLGDLCMIKKREAQLLIVVPRVACDSIRFRGTGPKGFGPGLQAWGTS